MTSTGITARPAIGDQDGYLFHVRDPLHVKSTWSAFVMGSLLTSEGGRAQTDATTLE